MLWILPFLGISKTRKKFPISCFFLLKIIRKMFNSRIIKYSSFIIRFNKYENNKNLLSANLFNVLIFNIFLFGLVFGPWLLIFLYFLYLSFFKT